MATTMNIKTFEKVLSDATNTRMLFSNFYDVFYGIQQQEKYCKENPFLGPYETRFALDSAFLEEARGWPEPWTSKEEGEPDDALSGIVFYRTYSRDGESWWHCVKRVVECTYRLQEKFLLDRVERGEMELDCFEKIWDQSPKQTEAQEMFRRMYHMKFLPPGRGLWAMGTPIIEERGLFAALNNCGFISTRDIGQNFGLPFCWLMDAAMLGVGVGIDLKGGTPDNAFVIKKPIRNGTNKKVLTYEIPDSREGWVESLYLLLDSYVPVVLRDGVELEQKVYRKDYVHFDYSVIRPKGTKLKTFGGISAGADPLIKLHIQIRKILDDNDNQMISSRTIADLCNVIGVCVMSGNIRRTAEILFGEPDDDKFLNLKNYSSDENKYRTEWGWASNNSIYATVGMDYGQYAERIADNGEPGFLWLDNARMFGRINGNPLCDDLWRDARAAGANPCNEQTLEDGELCNLVEVFIKNHDSKEDFLETLYYAFLYAKTVTLFPTGWAKTNEVMMRNRRIGTGISGIVQFIESRSLHELTLWLDEGYRKIKCQYDKRISEYFGINESVKVTTIKPSGTVSLLAKATTGMHFPVARTYIRRVTLAKNNPYLPLIHEAGYHTEPKHYDDESVVVEIPYHFKENVRTQSEVSMWEQLMLAAHLQKYWSDNQVSATINFKPEEKDQLEHALQHFQYALKGISFLCLDSKETNRKVEVVFAGEKKEDVRDEDWFFGTFGLERYRFFIKYDPVVDNGEEGASSSNKAVCEFSKQLKKDVVDRIIREKIQANKKHVAKAEEIVEYPYPQMPYEPISHEKYLELTKNIKPIRWSSVHRGDAEKDDIFKKPKKQQLLPDELRYCDGDKCVF